jgi:hypothetical protein
MQQELAKEAEKPRTSKVKPHNLIVGLVGW